jgi:hypothetical protein
MERSIHMEKMISDFLQNNMEGLLLGVGLVLILCTIAELHKINKLGRRAEAIIKMVGDYLSAVLEDEENGNGEYSSKMGLHMQKTADDGREKLLAEAQSATAIQGENIPAEIHTTEEQSRLISDVLKEVFS